MGDRLSPATAGKVQETLRLAEADPHRALEVIDGLAGLPGAEGSLALARGLALQRLGRREPSVRALREAEGLLSTAGRPREAARARVALALEAFEAGRVEEALELLGAAEAGLRGAAAARVAMQRALILQRAGRVTDTLDDWTRALRTFRRSGDLAEAARAQGNRGLVHVYRGEYAAAEVDLRGAETLFGQVGDEIGIGEAVHNRGFLAARRGDLPSALRLFDQAQERLGRLGAARPEMLLDRAETLLDAGVADEALQVAKIGMAQLGQAGRDADRAEAALLVSRACEDSGNPSEAAQWAEEARQLFAAQGRPRWELLAEYRALTLSVPDRDEIRRAGLLAAIAGRLRSAGWPTSGIEADSHAVTLWSSAGQPERSEASRSNLARLRRRASPMERLSAWLGEAEYRLAVGDGRGVQRALDAALRAARDHQLGVGSLELRARVAARAGRIIDIGLREAATAGRPERALRWVEAVHAAETPGRPPLQDPEAMAALESLRSIGARLDREPVEPHQLPRLHRQRAALEEVVRRRSRYADGPSGETPEAWPVGAILASLGDRILIEYACVGEQVFALSAYRGRVRLHPLSRLSEMRRAVAGLRMAIQTELMDNSARMTTLVDDAARAVAEQVVPAQLIADVEDAAGIVVVPIAAVASVAWGALGGVRDRDLVVASSATAWARAESTRRPLRTRPRVLSIAGPGLSNAAREAELVADLWGSQTAVMAGTDAGAASVLAAMGRADVVHVAAHGRFRGDNPLLSSIELADGPLSAYELSRIERPPHLVVFSSCDSGMASADGVGILGISSLLHHAGVESVVASVTPVLDDRSPALMRLLHEQLRVGTRPARAVSRVNRAPLGSGLSPPARGFVCVGVG